MSSNLALQQTQVVQASQTQAGTEVQKGTVFRAQIKQDSAFVKRVARLCTESDVAIKQLHLDLKWLNLAVRKAAANKGTQKQDLQSAALQMNTETAPTWRLLRLKKGCGRKAAMDVG